MNEKQCPSCGSKCKSRFIKKWWFIVIVAMLIIGGISSIGKDGKENSNDNKEELQSELSETSTVETSEIKTEVQSTDEETTENVNLNNQCIVL